MGEKEKFWLDRLEFLKQSTINNNCCEIDFNNPKHLYDCLMKNVFSGEFDSIFPTESLKDLSYQQKEEIFKMVRESLSMILFMGEIDLWADSVEGVFIDDYEFLCIRILDNFEFLLDLVKNGGKDVINLLSSFQKADSSFENIVVERLRDTFDEDELLKSILLEMSKQDGEYSKFSDKQKAMLCKFPKNILYKENGNHLELVSSSELLSLSSLYPKIEDFLLHVMRISLNY